MTGFGCYRQFWRQVIVIKNREWDVCVYNSDLMTLSRSNALHQRHPRIYPAPRGVGWLLQPHRIYRNRI